MSKSRLTAYLYLILVAAIWGAAGPVIKFTLGAISPLVFLAYRFTISAAVSVVFMTLKGTKLPKNKKTLLTLILFGFLTSTVALGLLFLGLDKTTVLDVTVLALFGPLLIVLAGLFFLKEHITLREKLGIAIAIAGFATVIFGPLLRNNGNSGLSGNFIIVIFLLVNSASALLAKILVRKKVAPITLANVSFIIGFLTLTPFVVFTQGPTQIITSLKALHPVFHLGVLYMALLSGNLAYTLWARGQRSIEISEAALFTYLQPIFAAPLAVLWLKEEITTPFVAGAIIISIGIIVAEYKKSHRN